MSNKEDSQKMLRGFIAHGAELEKNIGNQRYGDCPFCDKEDKFYVNENNGLWDCKVCGLSGNFQKFLEYIVKRNCQDLRPRNLLKLANNRKLPEKAFKNIKIGFYNGKYTFPVFDVMGKVQDIRIYKLGTNIVATANCKTGLWGVNKLVKTDTSIPVYICEGEWDGIALNWLINKINKSGVVVAVPGANTFKKEWINYFEDRKVICLYDNDDAGNEGKNIAKLRLSNIAKSIKYIKWPNNLPNGFDIRDFIVKWAIAKKRPKSCFKKIHEMLSSSPVIQTKEKEEKVEKETFKAIKASTVFSTIRRWLYLNNMDGVEIAMAAMVSNQLAGDPLWAFIVAPPGGAKTEILSMFSSCPESYFTSSLTPHSLISGSTWTNGTDPSLIPRLDKKVLIIKDFTTILTKRDQERDEIFGILRDAYDGSCSKVFGTGVRRHYESKFSILSAVTPKIYELAETHQALGERFLKFCIGENLEHYSHADIISRAINNLQKEVTMREEMAEIMRKFIGWKLKQAINGKSPIIPRRIQLKIIALAQFGARLRGTVARDKYRPEIINAAPFSEVGSRLGKQLAKLAVSLALVNDRDEVNDHDYLLVKKTMLDTIPQRIERVVREMFRRLPNENQTMITREISATTRFSQTTISRLLADLDLLKIVERKGTANKYTWGLSKYLRDLIKGAELYSDYFDLERASMVFTRKKIKVKIKKKKIKMKNVQNR